jgi:hypothetical protein
MEDTPMKRLSKKLLSATLALLMLVSVFASIPLTASAADNLDSASTWARENITSALAKGFIPADIQGNYTAPITRQEFCRMAVKFVEYYTGKSIDAVMSEKGVARQQNAFSDTNDQDILAAYALGITSGTVAPTATVPGKFDPDAQFNREQAATMLQRVCRVVGMNASAVTDQGYTDISSASSWAVEAINYCYANKIMTGTSTTPLTFSPKDTYSREQSIITFDRIVKETLGGYSHKTGQFRDMDNATLLKELGVGYNNESLAYCDPRLTYDPYPSAPIRVGFGLINRSSGHFVGEEHILRKGEKANWALDLKSVSGGNYETDSGGGGFFKQDVSFALEVKNARIELPGRTITLGCNGEHSVTLKYEPRIGWMNAGFIQGELIDVPAEELQKGKLYADITLTKIEGPSKADYYMGLNASQPLYTSEWFKMLKDEGFGTIRFQVTWINHTDDTTYAIDKAWLDKVEEHINLALEEGFYVSINMYGDNIPDFTKGFTTGMTEAEIAALPNNGGAWLQFNGTKYEEERWAAVWKQIAERFKDYDERLMFEAVNEPWARDYNRMANTSYPQSDIAKYNQIFVDTVRNTGGNNSERFLIVMPWHLEYNTAVWRDFVLPKDPTNHTIVQMHTYSNDEGRSNPFPVIEQYFIPKGISVILPEFAENPYSEGMSRLPYATTTKWIRESVAKAKELGVPYFWYGSEWGSRDNPNDPMACLYNPYTFEPAYPEWISLLFGK